jgi:hypothetical protein
MHKKVNIFIYARIGEYHIRLRLLGRMNIFHVLGIQFLKLLYLLFTHFKMRETITHCIVVFQFFNMVSCELPLELEHARLVKIMIFFSLPLSTCVTEISSYCLGMCYSYKDELGNMGKTDVCENVIGEDSIEERLPIRATH